MKLSKLLFSSVLLMSLSLILPTSKLKAQDASTLKVSKKQQLKGEIVKQSFVTKGGKITDQSDLFFKTHDKEIFIKVTTESLTRIELEALMGKSLGVNVALDNGLWDTDDKYTQSRVGDYVVILKVLSEKNM